MSDRGVLLVGIGHPDRGDDGAGLLVVRRLARAGAGAEIRESTGDLTSLLETWAGRPAVVLVDAVTSGAPAGTVHVMDLVRDALPASRTTSNHGFGIAETVALARALGVLPPAVMLVGIEGTRFGAGEPLSDAVAAALPAAAAAAERELERFDALTSNARGASAR